MTKVEEVDEPMTSTESSKTPRPRQKKEAVGSGDFICSTCSKRFQHLRGAKNHMTGLHGLPREDKVAQCSVCCQVFANLAVVQEHMITLHSDVKPETLTAVVEMTNRIEKKPPVSREDEKKALADKKEKKKKKPKRKRYLLSLEDLRENLSKPIEFAVDADPGVLGTELVERLSKMYRPFKGEETRRRDFEFTHIVRVLGVQVCETMFNYVKDLYFREEPLSWEDMEKIIRAHGRQVPDPEAGDEKDVVMEEVPSTEESKVNEESEVANEDVVEMSAEPEETKEEDKGTRLPVTAFTLVMKVCYATKQNMRDIHRSIREEGREHRQKKQEERDLAEAAATEETKNDTVEPTVPEDWNCPKCSFRNNGELDECKLASCRAPRSGEQTGPVEADKPTAGTTEKKQREKRPPLSFEQIKEKLIKPLDFTPESWQDLPSSALGDELVDRLSAKGKDNRNIQKNYLYSHVVKTVGPEMCGTIYEFVKGLYNTDVCLSRKEMYKLADESFNQSEEMYKRLEGDDDTKMNGDAAVAADSAAFLTVDEIKEGEENGERSQHEPDPSFPTFPAIVFMYMLKKFLTPQQVHQMHRDSNTEMKEWKAKKLQEQQAAGDQQAGDNPAVGTPATPSNNNTDNNTTPKSSNSRRRNNNRKRKMQNAEDEAKKSKEGEPSDATSVVPVPSGVPVPGGNGYVDSGKSEWI